MTFTLGAPQIIWIVLCFCNILVASIKHGQEQSPYNAYVTFVNLCIYALLLHWGGFFG